MAQDAYGNYVVYPPTDVADAPNDTGGAGGGGQVVQYAAGTAPGDIPPPDDPTQPAFAYADDGSTSSYGWNVDDQIWN